MYKVSIVMPVYNAACFLDESIGDILAQTEKEFELICVDDGSVDNSPEIIQKYSKMDERVKFIHQEKTGGGAARNNGLKMANGKYVLFLDADDRFECDLIKDVFEKAEDLQTDVLVFGGDLLDFNTGEHRVHPELLDISALSENSVNYCILTDADKESSLFRFTNATVWNKLIKKEFVVRNKVFFQNNYAADTLYFTMMVLFIAERIGFLNKEFVHYRYGNPEGQLSNNDKNPSGMFEALSLVKKKLEERNDFEKYERVFTVFAADTIMRRFIRLKQFDNIKNIHNMLHEYGLKELHIESQKLKSTKSQRWMKYISEIEAYPYDEYLFVKSKENANCNQGNKAMFRLPQLPLDKGRTIAIYGAGNVGKAYFMQLFGNKDYQLKLWVDKKWEKIGFPVQDINELRTNETDLIIIAVNSKDIANEISEELMQMGIHKERIFWNYPQVL